MRSDQTSAHSRGSAAAVAMWMPLLSFLGTGGVYSHDLYINRGSSSTFNRSFLAELAEKLEIGTAAETIERIQSVLKVSVTRLAECLGVSRQAVYDWRRGGDIKSVNLSRLNSLADAATVISGSASSLGPLQLSRKLTGGLALLEMIAAGYDGGSAAQSLLDLVEDEAAQHSALASRLANRQLP